MGVITLPWSMVQDQQNQIKANSVHVDDNFNTLLNATNGKLEADGSIVPIADLPMGNHKLTGVATPINSGDAATKGYVDNATTTLSASCVKTSGDQTIAGTKTFSNKITGSISGNCDGNAGTVTNGVYTTGNQTIGGTKTFSSAAYGTASDANNSIVTTVNKSKGESGYFQLGNGLIIQWGLIRATGDSRSVTFPKAFSGAGRYSVTVTPTGSNTGGLYTVSVNNNTSTGFTVLSSGNVSNVWLFWIAIGC